MNYWDMIKTEDTVSRFEAWKDYRKQLTSYILSCLRESCNKNSWVAIWGAGGCNDIDISELAKEYKLLLIDRDLEQLQRVREDFHLSLDRCKVADVGFWDIGHEDYEMFEALLQEGASYQELELFVKDLISRMPQPINLEKYCVDASVVVGLTSQLNARFAALLYMNRDSISHIPMDNILPLLNALNSLAVDRLYVSLRQLTRRLIITGYETEGCYSPEQALNIAKKLEQVFDLGLYGSWFLSGGEEEFIKVAGNEYWHKILYKAVMMDKLEDAGMCQVINWPFSLDKYYPMLMLALSVN